ncbi:MAG TPA: alpha/beta hydrolase [Gammaproteobacteria bacterium]|nr:alpha/beta hydrolase [Gammaproteobacteria bacterium]
MPRNLWLPALLAALLTGCEFGVDQSVLIKSNYHLLGDCERPELPQITSIVADALCGSISVFEDREAKDGRKIDLNVMLLPATTSVVKPDPIFFLAGGPGQSAVDSGPYLFAVLSRLRRERDVVLLDQRGTGKSNSLSCAEDSLFLEDFDLTMEEAMAKQIDELRNCLEDIDANPALYTTPIAMDDLNEVREVLGYREINLLGGSYGTRAALVYMRRHEETVRSAVLDGVVPLTMAVPANIAVDAQSSFELLLADCQAQPACARAFPDLASHFRELVQRYSDEIVEIEVTHPRTGARATGKIDPLMFNRLVRAIMYERTMSSLLPLAIEEAYNGNFEPLGTLGYSFGGEEPLISLGMMSSVLCAEDMTVVHEPQHSQDFDNQIYSLLEPICEFWPRGTVPSNYFEPVSSDKPTLLLSGKLDPVTPPKYAWEASATLSNFEHIVVAGVGHGVMTQGCVPGILADFFDNPDPKQVKAACTASLVRPDFFTSLAGPTQGNKE